MTDPQPDPSSIPDHFDWVARHHQRVRRRQRGFHRQLAWLFRFHVPAGARVLECGCGRGDLLAALDPEEGVGIDISPAMIDQARERLADRPNLTFTTASAADFADNRPFDVIILDYLTGYLEDIQPVLENLIRLSHPRTRILVTSLNTLWRPVLGLAQPLGLAMPQPPSNWLSTGDLRNLLELAGFEVIRTGGEQLFPFDWPGFNGVFNRFLCRLPGFHHLGATVFLAARPRAQPVLAGDISCSVVVPARNEAGNIRAALDRIPVLGRQTEVIFVEGNSTDDTWAVIEREVAAYDGPHAVQACRQPGKGKWDAVFTGFARARGDVLVIQDGDLTAPPEDLPKFFDAVVRGTAEFANGSRLVYPMESRAMRFLNLLGNKFFAVALSSVLRQPVKDSLCGTKMLLRADYERLLQRIEPFGDFDPFGDFNLLFGSALLDLKIRDIPIRYRDRTYGDTNISRFRHGWILLKMTVFGLRHLRFHR
ncbi:MAG: glycosyltransferase [Opitutales bacterium]